MEIQGIQVSSLPNGAHFNFMEEVTTRLNGDTAARDKISAKFTALTNALKVEDEALKISQKSLLTDDITEADSARDKLYRILKGMVENWIKHPDPAINKAAVILKQSIKDYNIDPNGQMDKETGLLTNLIGDWETKLKDQVSALYLTSTLADLKAKNELLKSLVEKRTDEYTVRNSRNLRAARLITDEAYRAVIKRVNAYLEIGEDSAFNDFANYMNTRIVHYKQQVLKQSAGKVPDDKPVITPDDPVTPPVDNPDSGDRPEIE